MKLNPLNFSISVCFCGRNIFAGEMKIWVVCFFLILDESSWLIRICRIKKGVTISNYVLTIIYLDLIRFLFHFINKIQNQSLQIKCLKKVIFANLSAHWTAMNGWCFVQLCHENTGWEVNTNYSILHRFELLSVVS